MKLEQQVCTLELAKRLKELGVKQESAFYWVVPKDDSIHLSNLEHANVQKTIADGVIKKISAFTVAEIGEMLPENTEIQKGDMRNGEPANWYVHLNEHTEGGVIEPDARAKMLIYLLEHKLVETVESVGNKS